LLTKDVGVLEVYSGILNGIGRVKQYFPFPIELNSATGFIYSRALLNQRSIVKLLSARADILIDHVFDVSHAIGLRSSEAHGSDEGPLESKTHHADNIYYMVKASYLRQIFAGYGY
jgi:hypothetical protein